MPNDINPQNTMLRTTLFYKVVRSIFFNTLIICLLAFYSVKFKNKDVWFLGCSVHARKKFTEAKSWAGYALSQISLLYQIEAMATDKKLTFKQ